MSTGISAEVLVYASSGNLQSHVCSLLKSCVQFRYTGGGLEFGYRRAKFYKVAVAIPKFGRGGFGAVLCSS